MMSNPTWWPRQFPRRHLCIKHRTETIEAISGMPRTAILVENDEGGFLVFPWKKDNPTELEAPIPFESVDAVLVAGWIVD